MIFITGPVRSGKSKLSVEIASAYGGPVVFVATYRINSEDVDMLRRINLHRLGRPRNWLTLESPANFMESLHMINCKSMLVIVDCLSLWLSDRLIASDLLIIDTWRKHLVNLIKSPWPVVIVSSEVGWGIISDRLVTRRFCDLLGLINQFTSSRADEVLLCVSDCCVRIK